MNFNRDIIRLALKFSLDPTILKTSVTDESLRIRARLYRRADMIQFYPSWAPKFIRSNRLT